MRVNEQQVIVNKQPGKAKVTRRERDQVLNNGYFDALFVKENFQVFQQVGSSLRLLQTNSIAALNVYVMSSRLFSPFTFLIW